MPVFVLPFKNMKKVLAGILVKNPAQRSRLGAAPKGTAKGSRHRAVSKNNKRKIILSLCLAPRALRHTSQFAEWIRFVTARKNNNSLDTLQGIFYKGNHSDRPVGFLDHTY
jgi:hypothetical protein